MLRTGVQTKGIIEEHTADSGFAMIKRAGFDCVDFNLDVFLSNTDVYDGQLNSFFKKSKQELSDVFMPFANAMEQHGIVPFQMHAPYPVKIYRRDVQNRFMTEEVIPKSLWIAGLLHIPYVVIHPVKLQYLVSREEEMRQNIEYFRSVIPCARENHVMVCMENLYESCGGRIVEGVCADPAEAVWYLKQLNEYAEEERFGFCLDTGHMNLVGRDAYETIVALGQHLKILHLHDNDARGDLHQLPFTFAGKKEHGNGVCWNQIIEGLRTISYEGVLSFETFPSMSSFPAPVAEQVLSVVAQTGRYLAEEIEKRQRADRR